MPATSANAAIQCRDIEAARRFYAACVRPLGMAIMDASEAGFTLGVTKGGSIIPLYHCTVNDAGEIECERCRIAFEAGDDRSVRAFYRAALEAGGTQLGYPGPLPTDGSYRYYAARVADPDGNEIEVGWRH